MTNQELINKLKEFPQEKKVVFFVHEDVNSDSFVWNECFIEDIKECQYIEFDNRIFFSEDDLNDYLLNYYEVENSYDREQIIQKTNKKEVIKITLNIS